MTPKQVQRLQTKIADVKRALAAEKRKLGAYDDSRGLRYRPTQYFIQLRDYKGGLTYARWFAKTFPDDVGIPDFLFEWTLMLFKTNHLPAARQKAWQTYCSNTYLFDKYFGRLVEPADKYEWSNLAHPAFTDSFAYSHQQAELSDFSDWLAELISSDQFKQRQSRYLAIYHQLKHESDRERRGDLLKEARQLERDFT